MGNLWKFSKDPISRRDHHRWFWGIQISYLRYVNYLQPGLHREKYRTLAVKNFQIWSLTLDPIQSSTIWTYEPLPTYGHLLVESHHSNVRKTLLWLFATLLCWFRTTKYLLGKCYFFIALIKQAPIIHRILYSFCEICNITKRKSIRKACIEFYLSLRRSI